LKLREQIQEAGNGDRGLANEINALDEELLRLLNDAARWLRKLVNRRRPAAYRFAITRASAR
jgi:hypothetical protein